MKKALISLLFCCLWACPALAGVFFPHVYHLENGLTLIVVPNHLSPAVTQMVWYKVGAVDEVAGKTGLAHYLEHLMFRGTTAVPSGQFHERIAAQGGNENAFTSFDYTSYHETVAADRLRMIMQLEADRMQNLNITAATAQPELQVVLEERKQRTDNSPMGRFAEKTRRALWGSHPYGRPVIGEQADIEGLSVADAAAFYQRYYAPNNATVIISGDVQPDDVANLAEETYGIVPRRDVPARKTVPMPSSLPSKSPLRVVDAGIEQPVVQWQVVVPSYATQKSNEAYALEVLAQILATDETGWLYRRLVHERALAASIEMDYDPDALGPTALSIEATPRPNVAPEKLAKAIRAELARLSKTGLTDEQVKDGINILQRQAIFARDSLMMPGYSFGMALTTGHSVEDVEAWPQRIGAVMQQDVNTALRNLLHERHQLTAFLLPDPKAAKKRHPPSSDPLHEGASIR